MKRNSYSAGAVKFSFWFMEFRNVVQMMNKGMTLKEIELKNKEASCIIQIMWSLKKTSPN